MTDIAAFLGARLDEDENAHREIHEARVCSGCRDGWEAGFDPDWCDCGYPARVLREVAAKREIVDNLAEVIGGKYIDDGEEVLAGWVLRNMAAVWCDHADYREEWTP